LKRDSPDGGGAEGAWPGQWALGGRQLKEYVAALVPRLQATHIKSSGDTHIHSFRQGMRPVLPGFLKKEKIS